MQNLLCNDQDEFFKVLNTAWPELITILILWRGVTPVRWQLLLCVKWEKDKM